MLFERRLKLEYEKWKKEQVNSYIRSYIYMSMLSGHSDHSPCWYHLTREILMLESQYELWKKELICPAQSSLPLHKESAKLSGASTRLNYMKEHHRQAVSRQ